MSMLLMVEAMKLKVGNPLRKLVLIKLADNASDKGECFPSIAYIADQCEISERSVQNHIKQLEVDGLLTIESRKSENGLNKSNIYHLNFSGVNAAPYGANNSNSGANAAPSGESPAPSGGANAAPITSNIESVKEPVNNHIINGFDFSSLKSEVSNSAFNDFVSYRKSIKKPLTQSAINHLVRELNKAIDAGYDATEIMEMTLSRGWQSFSFNYLNNQQQVQNKTQVEGKRFMTRSERNAEIMRSL